MGYTYFRYKSLDPLDVEKHMQGVEGRLRKVEEDLQRRGRELEKRGRELEKHGRELLERAMVQDGMLSYAQDGMFSYVKYATTEGDRGAGRTVSTEVQTMHYYLLVYEPKGGGNTAGLAKTLQKMAAWWNFVDRVWIIGSEETADALWKRLTGLFGKNDNVLVIELPSGPDRQGWLPEKAWDWFNKSMPRGKQPPKPAAPTKLSIPYSAYQDGGEVLIVPEGVRLKVTRGAESVHFAASTGDDDVPRPTRPAPPPSDFDVAATPSTPPAPPKEQTPDGQDMLICDFCGSEAPAYVWVNGDCPRCGIRRNK